MPDKYRLYARPEKSYSPKAVEETTEPQHGKEGWRLQGEALGGDRPCLHRYLPAHMVCRLDPDLTRIAIKGGNDPNI